MRINRLLIFFATFVVTIATLTTATAAWISLPRVDRLENIALNILSDPEFQISLDGINYYDNITKDILDQYFTYTPSIYNYTSIDGKTFTTLDGSYGRPELEFDLYFRSDRAVSKYIYLVNNVSKNYTYDEVLAGGIEGTYCISQGYTWCNNYGFDNGYGEYIEEGEIRTYYMDDCVRIAFNEEKVTNGLLINEDNRTTLHSLLFDPSEDESRGFGKEFGAFDYYQKAKNTKLIAPTEIPNTIYKLSSFNNETEKMDNNDSLIAVMQLGSQDGKIYQYAKVHVAVWLEGWDPDCIDGLKRDFASMQFQFKCADPA